MLKELYQWLQDLAVYLILVSAVLQALPQESYQKYVRFFAGLVLIVLLMTPLLKLTDMEYDFAGWVEEQKKELEQTSFWKRMQEEQEQNDSETFSETEGEVQIEVGEVQVGE